MLAAHPPGQGTGSAVRGAASLCALRALFERVDVVALAFPDEERFADPEVRILARPGRPPRLSRLAMLARGGAYYYDERGARVADRLRALASSGALLERYDLAWCHSALLARAAHGVPATARVLDIDNLPSADLLTRGASGGPRRVYDRALGAAFRREERRRSNLYDVVTVTSETERAQLEGVRPRVVVLSNCVPAAPQAPVAGSGPLVLFVGSLDYEPNIDAVAWMSDAIVPRLRALVPGVAVRVVGRRPGRRVRELCAAADIELVADAPSLTAHHHAARLVIAPLRSGGGTGRIKVLEALAHGVPVVATPQAVAGLSLTSGVDVQVASDAEGLARAAAALLADRGRAARIGQAGRKQWRRSHDPAAAERTIAQIIGRLVTAEPPGSIGTTAVHPQPRQS